MLTEQISSVQLAAQIAKREISSYEVVDFYLQRLHRLEPQISAMVNMFDDQALLEQAKQVDNQIQRGRALGPLAGLPITVKDVLCMKGLPTTCSSRMLANYLPPYNASSVQRVIDAGMIILGKTNMDEFAMGSSTESSAMGATRNPWALDHTPGGSSGGSAASVAAGMSPLSIGTDTGGSVRQPAAFCGICGLKPTYGLVSRYGLVAYASSLDQVGPMAHHVEDLAAMLQIIAGGDKRDSTSLHRPLPDYSASLDRPLNGLKVGIVSEHLHHTALDPEIAAGVHRARELLESMGAQVQEVHLPHSRYSVATYYVIAPCEASSNLARYDAAHYGFRATEPAKQGNASRSLESMMVTSRSQGFGEEVQRRIMLGTFALSSGYADAFYKKALKVRRLIANDYQTAFAKVDVLLGPAFPSTAYPLGQTHEDPVQIYLGDQFTVEANLAGLPAISLPAGQSARGLPLAIQLQAPQLCEERLLNIGHQLQKAGLFTPRVAPVDRLLS